MFEQVFGREVPKISAQIKIATTNLFFYFRSYVLTRLQWVVKQCTHDAILQRSSNLTYLYLQCLNVQELSPFVQPYLNNFWIYHRVYRVPSFLSSRPNWDSLAPSPAGECVPPSFGSRGGGTHSLAGPSQFRRRDRHSGTLGIYVLCGIYCTQKDDIEKQLHGWRSREYEQVREGHTHTENHKK